MMRWVTIARPLIEVLITVRCDSIEQPGGLARDPWLSVLSSQIVWLYFIDKKE